MAGLYKCRNCGEVFEEPREYVEHHGFNDCFAERWSCCPYCGGDYVEVDDDGEEERDA